MPFPLPPSSLCSRILRSDSAAVDSTYRRRRLRAPRSSSDSSSRRGDTCPCSLSRFRRSPATTREAVAHSQPRVFARDLPSRCLLLRALLVADVDVLGAKAWRGFLRERRVTLRHLLVGFRFLLAGA